MPSALSSPLPVVQPRLSLGQRLALAYVRREAPGWGLAYRVAGGADQSRWLDHGMWSVRGKRHGYRMELDLANWSERLSWFLARYHDRAIQDVLGTVLHPGDTFVDVGANIGMLTLLAARIVGPAGRVFACEPNPRLVARIEAALRANDIRHAEVVQIALANEAAGRRLFEFAGHSGWGSLVEAGPAGAAVTGSVAVRCERGDDVLTGLPPGAPMVIKIDVEGYEVPALQGLAGTLRRESPAVLIEMVDEHQRRAGFSTARLRGELECLGYRGFALLEERNLLRRYRTRLRTLVADEPHPLDVLFVPPAGPMAARIAGLLPRLLRT